MVFPADISIHDVLIGCYRKYKSYVFYSSGMSFKKKDVAEFEADSETFEKSISSLESALRTEDRIYFSKLFRQINYVVLPKMSLDTKSKNDLVISNEDPDNLTISKVNFFISLPVELSILDVLWTLIFYRICLTSSNEINSFSYANIIDDSVFVQRDGILESINFSSYKLFKPYYRNYIQWKNQAINIAEGNYGNEQDSTIFSLDLKEFFYSIDVDFSLLPQLATNNKNLLEEYSSFSFLSWIIETIHQIYRKKVVQVRKGLGSRLFLPIGLPSSGVIANVYMLSFDESMAATEGVDSYARYVDDILIVKKGIEKTKNSIDLLLSAFPKQFKRIEDTKEISLCAASNIIIQKDKIKVIQIYKDCSECILSKLKTDIATPSEPRLMPNIELSLDDFQKLIYGEQSESIKVRDATSPGINQKYLMKYFSDYLYGHKNTFLEKEKAEGPTTREAKIKDQIEKTLSTNLLLHLYQKWDAIFSFAFLCDDDKQLFAKLFQKAKGSISALSFSLSEPTIIKKKKPTLLLALKSALKEALHLSASSAYAVTLNTAKITHIFTPKIKKMGVLLRKCDMFNLRLCAFPMLPFSKNPPNNLYVVNVSKYLSTYSKDDIDQRKIALSPCFIAPQDFFIYQILRQYDAINAIDYQKIMSDYQSLFNKFDFTDCPEIMISIPSNSKKEYQKTCIDVYGGGEGNHEGMYYIALANMNLTKHRMILDHSKLQLKQASFQKKKELYRLLNNSYLPKIKLILKGAFPSRYLLNPSSPTEKERHETMVPVDILVLPEASVPLEWISEIAEFSRRSQIAVVCGVKYVLLGNRIINSVATILPEISDKKHKSSFVFLREKNVYAPEEKRRIKDNGFACCDQTPLVYYVFSWQNINFAVFNCYELTDIMSRAVVGTGRLDLLIATEYNKDIAYFSNIAESASRDLFCYVCQVNSSDYGDSKIIGPLKEYRKTIASISGGEKDSIHIGGINVGALRDYQICEHEQDFVHYKEGVARAGNVAKHKNDKYEKLLVFSATSANLNKGK